MYASIWAFEKQALNIIHRERGWREREAEAAAKEAQRLRAAANSFCSLGGRALSHTHTRTHSGLALYCTGLLQSFACQDTPGFSCSAAATLNFGNVVDSAVVYPASCCSKVLGNPGERGKNREEGGKKKTRTPP
ncbi:hypothetical protein E2320_017126 [Naja naja]|nr:hypothetical protein E2320_017126 [Naja naja]